MIVVLTITLRKLEISMNNDYIENIIARKYARALLE